MLAELLDFNGKTCYFLHYTYIFLFLPMIKNYVSPTIVILTFSARGDSVLTSSDTIVPFNDVYKSDFLVSDFFND